MRRVFILVALIGGPAIVLIFQLSSSTTAGDFSGRVFIPVVYKQLMASPSPTYTPITTPNPTATSVPPVDRISIGNPIVSRGKPAYTNIAVAGGTVDGMYGNYSGWRPGLPSANNPAWLAIQIGVGYSRLILNWTSTANYNYGDTTYGALGDYLIQTSADSTNGADGNWTTPCVVVNNSVRQRVHSFDFAGKSWVRIYVTAAAVDVNASGIFIDEIDVHDISQGAEDVWVFLGDSITAGAFDRRSLHQPSFAAGVAAVRAGFFPAMVNAGVGGEDSGYGASRVDSVLQLNPDVKFVAIHYGANDAAGNNRNTVGFRSSIQTIINKVKAAGKTPVFSRIQYAPDGQHTYIPEFNLVLDELVRQNGLISGPDFYSWFQTHPNELSGDHLHPNDTGYASINRLWTEAMISLYQ